MSKSQRKHHRLALALSFTVLIGAVAVSGILLGRSLADGKFHAPASLRSYLAVGDSLPDGVVYASPDSARWLSSVVGDRSDVVLILFPLGCSRCLDQAVRWNAVSEGAAATDFIGLACGTDWTGLDEFRRLGEIDFELFVCDPFLTDAMRLRPGTSIVRLVDGSVSFVASGDRATDELEALFRRP